MNVPARLGLFGVGLAAIFAVALGVGRLAGPVASATDESSMTGGHGAASHDAQPSPSGRSSAVPGGLQVAQDGYRLVALSRQLSISDNEAFAFQILGPDGKPVTAYKTAHDKDLHLIVARRDLSVFQHLHPALGADGVWSVPIKVGAAGPYRVFADFQPAARDKGLILGVDVTAPGNYEPLSLPCPSRTVAADGYSVSVEGALVPGTQSKLTLTVTKDGALVTDLDRYLGSYGHLVVLRDGDLAYLHVHPEEATKAGPQIVFYAEVPSAGDYRLFLDFQHQDVVRTAAFTAIALEKS